MLAKKKGGLGNLKFVEFDREWGFKVNKYNE